MAWLRARKGWGAGLALLALALQLVVAFGHTHRTGPAVSYSSVAENSRDAGNDSADGVTGICHVCFTLAQTAAGSVATAPPVAQPEDYADALFVVPARAPIAAQSPAFFWSRGPPIS